MNENSLLKTQPVRIVFDIHAEHRDIITGRQLPESLIAHRDNVRFYENRLDNPVTSINYMFAPMVSMNIGDIVLMRKVYKEHIWALVSKSGAALEGLNPLMTADIVKIYAVSIIPLDSTTQKPLPPVTVLFDSLYLIEWEKVDHWLSFKTQEAFEAEDGIRH